MSAMLERIQRSKRRLAMPVAVYPGMELAGTGIHDVVTSAEDQAATILALHRRYGLDFAMTAMDLSVEAECFGASVQWHEGEVPTVVGTRIRGADEIADLTVPETLGGRTGVALETVGILRETSDIPAVLGGLIGPFSLAARLCGVGNLLEMTLDNPDAVHALLAKTTAWQTTYARAFREAGAAGVVMAEPAAGLLSPRGMAEFASPYIRRIVEAVETDHFEVILHNCGATVAHLPALLDSGARFFHFGAAMNLPQALERFPADVVVSGNLDPAEVFVSATAGEARARTAALLAAAAGHRNFVLSSGCDLPPNTKLANLDAFFAALREGPERVDTAVCAAAVG